MLVWPERVGAGLAGRLGRARRVTTREVPRRARIVTDRSYYDVSFNDLLGGPGFAADQGFRSPGCSGRAKYGLTNSHGVRRCLGTSSAVDACSIDPRAAAASAGGRATWPCKSRDHSDFGKRQLHSWPLVELARRIQNSHLRANVRARMSFTSFSQ